MALLLVVGALYWETLYPGVGGRLNVGDSAKFQYAGKILGVPHEPGYPQYVVLNHLWTRLPLPLELATRVNLLSAVFSLLGGALFYVALRRLAASPWAAALGTGSLLLSRSVWLVSTEAEVYSLHLLYVAAALWAGERWWSTRHDGWLVTLVAVGAFSFGNHPLAVTLAAGVAVLVLGSEPLALTRTRVLLFGAVAVAASASQYLFVLWRSHSGVDLLEGIGEQASAGDLLRSMSGARFTSEHALGQGWGAALERLGEIGGSAAQQLGVPVLLLAVVGAAFLLRRRPAFAAFVVLPGLFTVGVVSLYQIGDWQGYLPPVWAALAALAAVGIRALPQGAVRGLGLVAWAVTLTVVIGVNAGRLRVTENPWDRGWLLDQAVEEDLVVTFLGGGYREHEVHRYYVHGFDEGGRPRVVLGRRFFAGDFPFVEPRRTYFAGDKVLQWFRAHEVDVLPGRASGRPPRPFLYTGTRDPVREVVVVPEGAGVTVRVRGEPVIRPPLPIQALVIGGTERRIKGVVRFDWEDVDTGGAHPLQALARRLPPDDWYCVVLDASGLAHHRRVARRIADAYGIPGGPRPDARRALVFFGRQGEPGRRLVLADPERTATLPLEKP